MINKSLLSSKYDEWETPPYLFNYLDKYYGPFNLDPCAKHSTAKCANYLTAEEDGLSVSWQKHRAFVNPPYGRVIAQWTSKIADEYNFNGTPSCALLPSRTDTQWFRYNIFPYASVILFVQGRIKFYVDGKESKNAAPFPSMIAIFDSRPREISLLNLKSVKV